jgi:spore germination cell wall hydrolase CwlJ-like protein
MIERAFSGVLVVRITSEVMKSDVAVEAVSNMPKFFRRLMFVSFAFLCAQLIRVDLAHADELTQSEKVVLDQNEAGEEQTSKASLATGTTNESMNTDSKSEVHCLALNIYFEARSEPKPGQRAVGHVVMNRVAHPGYPDSVCKVVRQGGEQALHRCQFSWWCDGRSDRPVNRKAWDQALQLAQEIYLGGLKDTTDGALWYHAVYVKPYWSDILRQGDKIGQHIFYLENRHSGKTM